jgi:hypothetical protein
VSLASSRRKSATAAIVLAGALFAGLNWLGGRHWWRGDWTSTGVYSLTDTTKKVVAGLKDTVKVTVFMRRESRLYQPVSELLDRYRRLSDKLEIEFLDPIRNPARARQLVEQFAVRQSTVVFQSGTKKKYVEEDKLADFEFAGPMGGAQEIRAFKGEAAFTSAILDVTESRSPKVYFTSGHGEPGMESGERGRGFSELKQALERQNRTVGTWSSLGKSDLPSDATVVIVAGPRAPFLEPEIGALTKFLAGGGRVLVMADPVLPTPGSPPSDFGLGGLLAAYGLKLDSDIVLDLDRAIPQVGPETFVVDSFGPHPIVQSLSGESLNVVFPLARSVSKTASPPAGYSETMLLQTTPAAWGETSLDKLDQVKKDPADIPGPLALGMAVAGSDAKKPLGRLVVFGSSGLAANGPFANPGNANLVLNAVSWLAGQERTIGIAPKTMELASVTMTRAEVWRVGLAAVLGMPLFAILLGVWVWYRRRD